MKNGKLHGTRLETADKITLFFTLLFICHLSCYTTVVDKKIDMANNHVLKTRSKTREATVRIPLAALRCILRYPNEKKIICEISTNDIKRLNDAATLDEIINEARLDYALGNFTIHKTSKSLIAALEA